jgi:hypothetical protein
VWAAHERVARNEQRKKEWEERQAVRKAAEKASKPNKYEQQVRWGPERGGLGGGGGAGP